jgi:hypothetical protein
VLVECVAVRQAAVGIKTFEFRAPKALRYQPGMYVSFDLQVGGCVIRINMKPNENQGNSTLLCGWHYIGYGLPCRCARVL